MNNFFKTVLLSAAVLSLTACTGTEQPSGSASSQASETAETGTGVYTLWNVTGEKITELYVYDNSTSDKGENYAGDGMRNYKSVEVTKADVPSDASFTLEFTTESGYTGSFNTLHVEETDIALPAADALTGATQIVFGEPTLTAEYVIYNVTGETVTDLYLFEENGGKGDNLAEGGLAEGQSVTVTKEMAASETGGIVYHVEFKTESGYEAEFTTLHFEIAPISLISEDAMTGSTPISFSAPE